MTRPFHGRAVLALLLLAAAPIAPAGAQSTAGILAPAGRLRLEVSPTLHLWDHRFGLREEGSSLIEEEEPLGFDLERETYFDVSDVEARLRTVLADPTLDLVLGSTVAKISRERNEVMFGMALGVFDWLTIGANVPLVQSRSEIVVDFRGTDLGPTPFGQPLEVYRAQLGASANALRFRRDQACPAGPDCAALTDLAARYGTFASELEAAYNHPLFLAAGSAPATALATRLAAFRTEASQRAPGLAMPGAPPLALPFSEEDLVGRLTGSSGLLRPFQTDMAPWELGDVEVTAALRLLEGAVRDSATAPARFRYRLGAQALVRLPTGTPDDPDVPLDIGGGDGQMDIELGGFGDVRWSRFGIEAAGRYGIQQETTLIRRVAGPEVVLAPLETRRSVRWTPGSYLEIEVAPRWHLTDELALGVLYRGLNKDEDVYEEVDAVLPGLEPASVLARETESTLTELGLGVAYSTVTAWREGRAAWPLDLSLAVRKAIAGSGGATPKGWRLEASGKAFVRLWGARPTPAL